MILFRLPGIAVTLAFSTILSAAIAGEGPIVDVDILNVDRIHTVTQSYLSNPNFKPHINFPWLEQRADGSLLSWWTIGQVHSGVQTGSSSQSFDGGDTWTTPTSSYSNPFPATRIKPSGQSSYSYELNLEQVHGAQTSWTGRRSLSTDGGHNWAILSNPASFNFNGVSYKSFYQQQGPVIEQANELLMTAYGMRNSEVTFETVLFASTDGGQNWAPRSTISAYVPGANAMMGEEGPTETGLIKLDNGNLLSVFRTGQPYPNSNLNANYPSLYSTISSDGGYTWTSPKMLGVVGVSPHLNKLDDGTIALTYGRAGIKMMFADPTGDRWSYPFVVMDESTSGHARMLQRPDGDWTLAYDRSSFYHPSNNSSPPSGYVYDNDQSAHMEIATLQITPQALVEDYDWTFEYHGNVTPQSLPVPWAYTQSGATSVRLWGDLGQDYLRTDSGSTGASKAVYYSLSGTASSSPWADVNFADGVVIDVRARAGSTTTDPGSASIFLGDGDNGYIILELTSNYIGLEGLGGNGGQVNYLPSGFSPRTWHDYRLIVDEDDTTGILMAKLYIDGNWGQEILSQQLNGTIVDEIRIGDQTGTNNGILDIDYFRFAPLSQSSQLLGDYNLDGIVDAADYVVWRDTLGQLDESSLNGNGDGQKGVDEGDYQLWMSQYGATRGGSGQNATQSIPEPTSGLLLACFCLIAVSSARPVHRRERFGAN